MQKVEGSSLGSSPVSAPPSGVVMTSPWVGVESTVTALAARTRSTPRRGLIVVAAASRPRGRSPSGEPAACASIVLLKERWPVGTYWSEDGVLGGRSVQQRRSARCWQLAATVGALPVQR